MDIKQNETSNERGSSTAHNGFLLPGTPKNPLLTVGVPEALLCLHRHTLGSLCPCRGTPGADRALQRREQLLGGMNRAGH